MVKRNKAREENDDSGGAVILVAIAATAGLWAWLRSRRQPAPVSFALRSQARSQVAATSPTSGPRRDYKPWPQFGYDDRAGFGFAF